MKAKFSSIIVVLIFSIFASSWCSNCNGQQDSKSASASGSKSTKKKQDKQVKKLPSKKFMKWLEGKWEGEAKTWFRPGELADTSKVVGEFKPAFNGRFLKHTYVGSMKGNKRIGEETIVFNPARKGYQVTWIDTFHMNYGILFSNGEATDSGFNVKGEYAFAPGKPKWGWRTIYKKTGENTLTITSYNIFPSGTEVKGVEIKYKKK